MIKLSELEDNQIVYREDVAGAFTVKELKRDIEMDAKIRDFYKNYEWCLGETKIWIPDAKFLLESYAESESDEMYEGWMDHVGEYISNDNIARKVQLLLEEELKDVDTRYYKFVESVEFDL